ncbi:MAG: A/G-specific adenine glycosylase [Tannerellaceae bacterium]|nr:A/G-specific adenine glycosylase [Tannerellaceae bacterium]
MNKDITVSTLLVDWYEINKRDLPWRHTKDPYKIWVSEIILQQTRIAQGMDYYLRFTERFPDVKTLAEAGEDEVLKYWQGLGYYSRARNMHTTAKMIVEKFGGRFPETYKEILSLKGIGEYTAAAIASFVWDQPYPVVDGNVYRVLARLYGVETPIDTGKGKKEFASLAEMVLNPQKAGLHNQAVMEFGALQCIPQNPRCPACPFLDRCVACNTGKVNELPVKQKKGRTRDRFFHYFHITYQDNTWLNRRGKKDIWEGLYEFPLIETSGKMDFADMQALNAFRELFGEGVEVDIQVVGSPVKHVLSHQVIYAVFYRVELKGPVPGLGNYLEIPSGELDKYAVSRLVEIYLERGGQLSFNYTV